MKLIHSISFLFLFWCSLNAQLIVSPDFFSNTLVRSPATLGAITQEGIILSSFSIRSKPQARISTFFPQTLSLRDILPGSNYIPSPYDLSNSFSANYFNTQSLPNEFKITYGLHFQVRRNSFPLAYATNTFGITSNLHIPLLGSNTKVRYFSAGIQMNLIHQNPNIVVTNYAFENLIRNPQVDFRSFHRQFSKNGFHYTLNGSYLRHKKEKSIFVAGLSLAAIEAKIANSFGGTETGLFSFRSETNLNATGYINWQFVIFDRIMFDLNIMSYLNSPYASFGSSFFLTANAIARISGLFSKDSVRETMGLSLEIEKRRYTYQFYFGKFREFPIFGTSSVITSSFPIDDLGTAVQLGVSFKISNEKLSLLNLKY